MISSNFDGSINVRFLTVCSSIVVFRIILLEQDGELTDLSEVQMYFLRIT